MLTHRGSPTCIVGYWILQVQLVDVQRVCRCGSSTPLTCRNASNGYSTATSSSWLSRIANRPNQANRYEGQSHDKMLQPLLCLSEAAKVPHGVLIGIIHSQEDELHEPSAIEEYQPAPERPEKTSILCRDLLPCHTVSTLQGVTHLQQAA